MLSNGLHKIMIMRKIKIINYLKKLDIKMK